MTTKSGAERRVSDTPCFCHVTYRWQCIPGVEEELHVGIRTRCLNDEPTAPDAELCVPVQSDGSSRRDAASARRWMWE
jgi:hypothetical protein